ncbi:MAG TPA: transcription termination factor Rho, partial [Solirubrobacteraceae bacterium]|nr:transcription termination factor Rho [Solirubrobacteraceae bacterium]
SEEGATDEDAGDEQEAAPDPEPEPEPAPAVGRRGGARREDETVEGTIELQPNGSALLRETGDQDVYISAAQVRRCELVDGDRVSGPVRPARRSERHPSLVRVQSINGRDADEVVDGTPFEELPAAFPTEAFALGEDDPTLKAIAALTPLGRGSRAVIAGPARTGKSEALRRLAGALHAQEDLDLSVVLCGVRPEELALWQAEGLPEPVACLSLAAAPDAQAQALERALDTARRVAARGGHAAVLVDSLAWVGPGAARKALAAARSLPDGGSLTVVAVAPEPVGGETTVITLDAVLAATARFPALDLLASGTLHPELLVGDAGAAAILAARAAAIDAEGAQRGK